MSFYRHCRHLPRIKHSRPSCPRHRNCQRCFHRSLLPLNGQFNPFALFNPAGCIVPDTRIWSTFVLIPVLTSFIKQLFLSISPFATAICVWQLPRFSSSPKNLFLSRDWMINVDCWSKAEIRFRQHSRCCVN